MPSLYSSKSSTGWQLRANYSTEPDILNNRTLVNVELYVYAGTAGSWNANTSTSLSAYYTIYGTRKYLTYDYPTKGWKYLGSRDFYVSHNNDGTKTFTFTANWYSRLVSSYTPPSLNISASITLPRIPRASTISAGSFTIGSSGNITINRASSSFTHKLTYSFGSASGTIGTGLGTSATWTPPTSLLAQVPTQTSKTCTITCTTYSGGTPIGTYSIDVTLYVASEVVPSISEATISPVNENSWIDEKGLYVGGFTKARIQTKATAGQGASIKSITINGASASDDWTSPILTAGEKSFIIRVTDTRGRYVEENVSALFLEYTQPLFVTAKAVRSDALGLEIDDGTYLYAIGEVTYSSLDGNNQVELKLRIRTSGGEWQPFVNLENNVAYFQDGLLLTASYEVEIVATDLVGSKVPRTLKIATALIDFHLRHGGRGAAFGKYSEIEGLEVDWETQFNKNVSVGGSLTVGGSAVVKQSDIAKSSNLYGKIPQIGNDGVIEVGKYIDMHDGNNSVDYNVRLQANGSNLLVNSVMALTTGHIARTTHTISSIAINGNTTGAATTATFTKSGYLPIGIVGHRFTGDYIAYANLIQLYLSSASSGSATVTYRIRNLGTNAISASLNVDILWLKVS